MHDPCQLIRAIALIPGSEFQAKSSRRTKEAALIGSRSNLVHLPHQAVAPLPVGVSVAQAQTDSKDILSPSTDPYLDPLHPRQTPTTTSGLFHALLQEKQGVVEALLCVNGQVAQAPHNLVEHAPTSDEFGASRPLGANIKGIWSGQIVHFTFTSIQKIG